MPEDGVLSLRVPGQVLQDLRGRDQLDDALDPLVADAVGACRGSSFISKFILLVPSFYWSGEGP